MVEKRPGRDAEGSYVLAKRLWDLKKSGGDCPAGYEDVWEVFGKTKAELREIWLKRSDVL